MDDRPLIPRPTGSPRPLPSDHLRLLIELLRPAGPELGRRWLAALLLVPEEAREGVVSAVEARIVAEFGDRRLGGSTGLVTAHTPPVQRDGYVEVVETTYEVSVEPAVRKAGMGRGVRRRSGT